MISSLLISGCPQILHAFGTKTDFLDHPKVTLARQVHGTGILHVTEPSLDESEADILLTDRKGLAVGVKTADCLPILLADPEAGLVAAVHAGWKGTVRRVVEVAIRRLMDMGARPKRLLAALGPCMQGCCYEVGEDVMREFETNFNRWSTFLIPAPDSKWLLDLQEANRIQILSLGVPPERIDQIGLCTWCRPDLFHSYRRDGEKAGRMVSLIQMLT